MSTEQRKNVVFVTVDGLNFANLGYGGKVPSPSPVIDGLLSRGLSYSRVFAVGCPTQFAMPGIFLSQLPLDEGGYEMGIQGRGTSFVEVLREAGYRTAGFTTAQSCAPLYRYDRGFDEFYSMFILGEIVRDVYTRRKKHYGAAYRAGQVTLEHCVAMIAPMLEEMFVYARTSCTEKEREIREGTMILSPSTHNWDFPAIDRVLQVEQARFRADPSRYVMEMVSDEEHGAFVETIEAMRAVRVGPNRGREVVDRLSGLGLEVPLLERAATARCVTDNVVAWLDRQEGDSPFFLWAHYLDCHEFNCTSFDVATPEETDDEVRSIQSFREEMEASARYSGHPPYDLAIRYVDHQVGRLVEALEEAGRLDDTLIVLTSDHGWPIGYPPRVTLDITDFYDELYRVPLAIIGAGIEPRRVEGMASTMDIPTTLLDLAGCERDPSMRGELIHREGWAGRSHVYWEHLGRGSCDFATKPISICVRSETHKILCTAPPLGSDEDGELIGMFDLKVDPTEQRNLVGLIGFPQQLEWMVEVVETRVAELADRFLSTNTQGEHDEAA